MKKESRSSLFESLCEAGVGQGAAQIAGAAELGIGLVTSSIEDTVLPIGASKIGGAPDLPVGLVWPEWKDLPLSFLAQIDTASVARFTDSDLLPSTGRLLFFYDSEQSVWGFDPKDRGAWLVLHDRSPLDRLTRVSMPGVLPDQAWFKPQMLGFEPKWTLPPWESIYVQGLGLNDAESDAYSDWLIHRNETGQPSHQLLGHPQPVQNEMQMECQLVSNGIPSGHESPHSDAVESYATDWRLLFQLDSDDNARMMWGDVGMLYFWVRRGDLKERAFDRTWMILQCC